VVVARPAEPRRGRVELRRLERPEARHERVRVGRPARGAAGTVVADLGLRARARHGHPKADRPAEGEQLEEAAAPRAAAPRRRATTPGAPEADAGWDVRVGSHDKQRRILR
jgi:hypothetical protein